MNPVHEIRIFSVTILKSVPLENKFTGVYFVREVREKTKQWISARYRRCSLARLLLAVNIFSLIFAGTGAL